MKAITVVAPSAEPTTAHSIGSTLGHAPSYAITAAVATKDTVVSFWAGFKAGFREAEVARKAK